MQSLPRPKTPRICTTDTTSIECVPPFSHESLPLSNRPVAALRTLLRSALHSFCPWRNIVIVVIVQTCCAMCSGLTSCINIFEIEVLDHAIRWWCRALRPRWQDLFEQLEISQLGLVRELDLELDVQVAKVVMSERWHSLAFDHFDRACVTLEIAGFPGP